MTMPIHPFLILLGVFGIALDRANAAQIPAVAERPSPAVASPAVAAKPSPPKELTPEQITALIKDLGARKFAVREAATKELSQAGRSAIPALTEAARSGDLEVTLRSIRILESLLTKGTLADFEAAETALEQLQESQKPAAASRAQNVLASMGAVREKRAIAAIEKLGGIVKSEPRQLGFVPNARPSQQLVTTVILKKRWKGGEAALEHLEKLRFLQAAYIVEGVVDPAAAAQLEQTIRQKQPNFQVQWRGGACLGVAGRGVEGGCEISYVNDGSAASNAGLRPGDLIVAFNGKRGEKPDVPLDFDRLVELIKEVDAGDKVPLLIRRNGREQTVEVIMDEWK